MFFTNHSAIQAQIHKKCSPPDSPATPVGVNLLVVSPVPSCPLLLSPQQSTPPSARRTQVWKSLPRRAITTPVQDGGVKGRQHQRSKFK